MRPESTSNLARRGAIRRRQSKDCLMSTFNPLRGCNSPEGTFDFWCSRAFSLVRQEHQRGGLASNPKPQWCLVVAKPDHEHGIRRCDQFIGGGGAPKCSPRPRLGEGLN